MAVEELERYK